MKSRPSSRVRSAARLAPILLVLCACQEQPASQPEAVGEISDIAGVDRLLLASSKVALPPPGLMRSDLPEPDSPGAQALATYCVTCHAMPSPLAHSATDWPAVQRRMWLRMDRIDPSFNLPIPTSGDRIAMSRYLVDNALVVSSADLPEGVGREAFVETCAQCHELPDPRQHGAEDWVSVVSRMMDHMQAMLGETLDRQDLETISGYLGAASTSS